MVLGYLSPCLGKRTFLRDFCSCIPASAPLISVTSEKLPEVQRILPLYSKAGSSGIIDQGTTADWAGAGMEECNPVEEVRVSSTLSSAEEKQNPAAGIDPTLSNQQSLPLRERAHLAASTAAAASEAAQRAAAYSAAASSAASSAAAAVEKAMRAAGVAQITLESHVEEAVQEVRVPAHMFPVI